ncbi:MAG: flagellar hook-associated protein FlgL [Burkholderiales bacterium]|nr:flagellar hook-associated protein FlgL [Burkholderiales bacterium]
MRIASSTIYANSVYNMDNLQVSLNQQQEQLSTGRKVLTPSDDPVASARSLDLTQAQSQNTQYQANISSANSALSLTESNLGQVVTVIQDIQQLAVQSGDAALTSTEKGIIASDIQAKYQQLMGLANSTDGNGQYLFSGYAGATKPFNETSFGNVNYQGDDGQRLVQISTSRQVPVSDSGSSIFVNIKNGNGTFQTTVGQPDLPRTVTVADSGPIQFSRDPAGGYVPSKYSVSWDGTNYTITRASDGATSVQAPASLAAGVTVFGMDIQSQGNPPSTPSQSATFDGTLVANQGTGVVDPGTITDPVAWTNANNHDDYRIAFHSVPNPNTPNDPSKNLVSYDIIDNNPLSPNFNVSLIDGYNYSTQTPAGGRTDTAAKPNSFPRTYTPGADIVLAQQPGEGTPLYAGWNFGAKLSVSGTPADGDSFDMAPSTNTGLFKTIGNFVNALNNYQNTSTSSATFQNQLNAAMSSLNNALTNVVTVQSDVGTRMKEAASTQTTNQTLNLDYQQTISGLTNLDYAQAISNFAQTQTNLQAAMQSYSAVKNMSLFQFIQ